MISFDLLTNIPRFFDTSINENFIRIFCKYINKYEGQRKEFFNACRGEKSIMNNENLVSYFPAREYKDFDDLAATIISPANCRFSTVNLPTKDNFIFAQT